MAVNASSEEMTIALESIRGLDGIIVKKTVRQESTDNLPFEKYTVEFEVAFSSSAYLNLGSLGSVPLLLVSTDGLSFGSQGPAASRGDGTFFGMFGSQFIATTAKLRRGGIESRARVNGVDPDAAYYARVRAGNGVLPQSSF